MTPLDRARAHLATPPGAAGSGWLRYSAAMSLYQAGALGAEALEVYRICTTLDDEDPVAILAARGLAPPSAPPRAPPARRLRDLLDEADRYLAGLWGPGIGEVRRGLSTARRKKLAERPARSNPVVAAELPAALRALAEDDPALAEAIAAAVPELDWITYDLYAPGTMTPGFLAGHAYASLVGAEAPYPGKDFDFGLFLIAPNLLYPDHRHAAPELYVPLTGPHGWRFGPGSPLIVKPAHEPIWNDPWAPHLTKVGPVPFLSFFGWTRDAQSVAETLPADDWASLEAMRLEVGT
jgi:hypothetical protein